MAKTVPKGQSPVVGAKRGPVAKKKTIAASTSKIFKKTPAKPAAKAKAPAKAETSDAQSAGSTGHYTTKGKIDIGQFYAFGQCSLRLEAKYHMDKDFELKDPEAKKIWPQYEKLGMQNLGKNEKWVPWHTVLGVHEHFLVKEVHHGQVKWWRDYEKFIAMFLFRCHCKIDLFMEVQMKYLQQQSFWKDLEKGFAPGSAMEKDMLKFRKTGRPLQTSCFLIIPERILKDDDENLVRNIVNRSVRLIKLAKDLWNVVKDKKTTSSQKYDTIAEKIRGVNLLGDTWVKMLMVCIDICLPDLKLLAERCEVGVGASDPMRKLLEGEGLLKPKVKKEMGVNTFNKNLGKDVSVQAAVRAGIACVKRGSEQVIQVTYSMANESFDRAYAIAEILGKETLSKNYTRKDQPKLIELRNKLFANKALKVQNRGLDKAMKEAQAKPAGEKRDPNEPTPAEALVKLSNRINESKLTSAGHFWKYIADVENHGASHYQKKKLPLITKQMKTPGRKISAVTLQVQLCEFRQFQNFLKKPAASKPIKAASKRIKAASAVPVIKKISKK
eukprot:TRINITY_DN19501_c0_g1_i1.p1 TRINITY_DN19501_c0_g1~~TRINITY_DN19501_c0_g1_i1.p1  ORF type:complete len:554 (-),score=127.96 TRINITY_DN19501_c0_g1_i1:179-1840(-)